MFVIDCNFDGACDKSSSEGIIGFGFHININKKEVYNESGFPSFYGTSNVSEYTALAALLTHLIDDGFLKKLLTKHDKLSSKVLINITGDSQVIIRQMSGEYRVTTDNLKLFNKLCKGLTEQFPQNSFIKFNWVKRHLNQRADQLSKKGLKKALKYWQNV
jgi:ribonuclease HI